MTNQCLPQHYESAQKLEQIVIPIPDVFPKESARLAVQQAPAGLAKLLVWNQDAFDSLQNEHISAELVGPTVLIGFEQSVQNVHQVPIGYPETSEYLRWLETGALPFSDRGVPVVVKSSGSGLPAAALKRVQEMLAAQKVEHYEIHLPDRIIVHYKGATRYELAPLDKIKRLERYFLALGKHTKPMICYPSEQVGVVYAMRQLGAAVQLEVLDTPRGNHEQINLAWAVAMGLVQQ